MSFMEATIHPSRCLPGFCSGWARMLNGDLVAVMKVEVAIHFDMFFPLSLERKEGKERWVKNRSEFRIKMLLL